MPVLASLVLGFAMFDALRRLDLVWLHLMPMRPYSDVTIWEAFPDAKLLVECPSLSCFVWWYAYHACLCYPLALYASLRSCSHVHAWVLLASVSSIPQHNEAVDTRSKPTFVPRRDRLLFAFLFVCLFAYLLAILLVCLFACCSHPCFYACHVYHVCLLYASLICPLHLFHPLLVCWFLVFAFTCTQMEWGRMKLGHGLPGASKKGKDVNMWI